MSLRKAHLCGWIPAELRPLVLEADCHPQVEGGGGQVVVWVVCQGVPNCCQGRVQVVDAAIMFLGCLL